MSMKEDMKTELMKDKVSLDNPKDFEIPIKMDKRFCKKCGNEMKIYPGDDIAHDINDCEKCGNRTIGSHQEPYGIDKKEVYEALDKIRNISDWLCDRIASYIEAMIDEFIECYEDEEE